MRNMFFVFFLLFLGSFSQLFAQEPLISLSPEASLTLEPLEFNDSSNVFTAMLHIKLEKNWKTYYQFPGDAGIAPQFNFSESKNIEKYEILWPFPELIQENGNIYDYTYKNNVDLPVKLHIKDPNKALLLDLQINLPLCNTVCMLVAHHVSYKVDKIKDINSKKNVDFSQFIQPFDQSFGSISNVTIAVSEKKTVITGVIDFPNGNNIQKLYIFADEAQKINFKPAKLTKLKSNFKFEAELTDLSLFNYKNNNKITILIQTDKGSFIASKDFQIVKNSSNLEDYSIYFVLLIAFLGGLIMNIMPCVLPVLSIKLMQILKTHETNRNQIKYSFLFTAFGIIFCFFLMSMVIYSLKQLESGFFLGMHMQSPMVIAVLAIIVNSLIFVSYGLIGYSVQTKASNWLSIMSLRLKHKYLISFFEGVLASALSTPCSAPFFGFALTYAVLGNALESAVVLLFIGLGLALPYIFIAFRPSLLRFLPKPGPWMNKLKHIIALLLLLTMAWLLVILANQIIQINFVVFLLCLAMFNIMFIFKNSLKSYIKYLILIVFLIMIYVSLAHYTSNKNLLENSDGWVPFSKVKLDQLIDQNELIFIDITAAWCLTCKVNKINVLDDPEIVSFFGENNVTLMRGDLTNSNKTLEQFIKSYNRFAVPFNVIYGPSEKSGMILSEILTKQMVIDKIKQAKKK